MKVINLGHSKSGKWHNLKMLQKVLKRAKKYPVCCCLLLGSLMGTLLLLTLASWEMELCLKAFNLDHNGHSLSMYHTNFTTDLLFSSGMLLFFLFILLATASLKNAFDMACLLMKKKETNIIYQKLPCAVTHRNDLEEFHIKSIIPHGYILKKKEKDLIKPTK